MKTQELVNRPAPRAVAVDSERPAASVDIDEFQSGSDDTCVIEMTIKLHLPARMLAEVDGSVVFAIRSG